MSNPSAETVTKFISLFGGRERIAQIGAFGTGKGEWIKRPLIMADVEQHLRGDGPGIGVGPLLPGNECYFAAIDLDEPDFEAAREMQDYIPGVSWLERSRSGNAHVWVFFDGPCKAWVAMGILKEATLAAGKKGVEVFPKNPDFTRVKYGNYINLPYHGDDRPILWVNDAADHAEEGESPGLLDDPDFQAGFMEGLGEGDVKMGATTIGAPMRLNSFIRQAEEGRSDPDAWERRAEYMMIPDPFVQRSERTTEFGTKPELHRCAEYIIANCDDNPLVEGHRNAVFFALAKMLSNCVLFDHDEALDLMQEVNDASPDPAPVQELQRILYNAERGEYTSTDCDNPLVVPYSDPDCPIAHPRSIA